jgi:hypothetical protein
MINRRVLDHYAGLSRQLRNEVRMRSLDGLGRKMFDGRLLNCCIDTFHGRFFFCSGHTTRKESRLDRAIVRGTERPIREKIVIEPARGSPPGIIAVRRNTLRYTSLSKAGLRTRKRFATSPVS